MQGEDNSADDQDYKEPAQGSDADEDYKINQSQNETESDPSNSVSEW